MKIWLLATIVSIAISESFQGVLIADNTMSKMIELSSKRPYCKVHNDRGIIQRMIFFSDGEKARTLSEESVLKLEDICKNKGISSPYQGGFIYPGTKWCGPGNIALNYDDLGIYKEEDKCCREHDNCPKALAKGECRQGLCNTSPYTRSHCDCDAELRRCLQVLNTDVSNVIGSIFFNIIQITCVKERPPCTQWHRNGYNQEEQDVLCAQISYRPSDRYVSQMPLPNA